MRWRSRALLVVAVAALLAMHGIDAASTAAHASHRAVAVTAHLMADHPAPDPDAPPSDHHGGLVHVAMACAAILLAVATVVAVQRGGARLGETADRVLQSARRATTALEGVARPPPTRVLTCVIRR